MCSINEGQLDEGEFSETSEPDEEYWFQFEKTGTLAP